jgi:hypothetical protein
MLDPRTLIRGLVDIRPKTGSLNSSFEAQEIELVVFP